MINPGIFERPNFVIIVVIGIIMTWKGTKIPRIKNEYIKAKAFFLDKLRAIEKAAIGTKKVIKTIENTEITAEFKKY